MYKPTMHVSRHCSTSGRMARLDPRAARGLTAAPGRRPVGRPRSLQVVSLLQQADGLNVTWSQTSDDVIIRVPIADGTRGKDIAFEVHPKRLKLQVKGQPVLEGTLDDAGEIDHDASFWNIEDEDGQRQILVTLAKRIMGYESWEQLLVTDKVDLSITNRVVMDLLVGTQPRRLVLGLFGNAVPRTVENFRALCTGELGTSPDGVPLTYEGSPLHRIIPGFMAQGGDITLGNGMGGESIYGPKFDDENFKAKHEGRGFLAMANAGANTNSSQFYITFKGTPHLDGKHVVFGKVEAGYDTLAALEEVGTDNGNPTERVIITSCHEAALELDPKELVTEFRKQQAAAKEETVVVGTADEAEEAMDSQEEAPAASMSSQ